MPTFLTKTSILRSWTGCCWLIEHHGIRLVDTPVGVSRVKGSEPNVPEMRGTCPELADTDETEFPRIVTGDSPKPSDDPVRMYLSQMAEIPLLTREEEISLAKKIEITRKQFRRALLENDYALRATVATLHRVHSGELPFDRTIKVSLDGTTDQGANQRSHAA